jgi:hypothetical protein
MGYNDWKIHRHSAGQETPRYCEDLYLHQIADVTRHYRKPNEYSPHQLILFPSAPPPGHLGPGLPSVLFPSDLHL